MLFLTSNVNSSQPDEFVNQVCSKQANVNLCLEVLKSDSRSEFAETFTIVTQIAVDFATKNATNTRDYFRGVTIGPPGVLKSLIDCIDAYNIMITSFQNCMSEDDCSLTSYDIHSAGDEIKRCQSIVDSNGAYDSFITTSNTITENVCWLCESLASLMCKDLQKF